MSPHTLDPAPPVSVGGEAPRRVLVVRDGRLAGLLGDACAATVEVERIPGFLGGLAELITGRADRLLGPAEALAGMREAMAATLLDAGLADRVVLTDPSPSVRDALLEAGFHAVLDAAASGEELAAAIGAGGQAQAAGEAGAEGPQRAAPPPGGPGTPVRPSETLGDSDLVEAIHDAGGGADGRLHGLIVRLLRSESGIPGIELVPEDEPQAGQASVRVCFRGECFGRLQAPPPAVEQALAPWAGWAARWLALEQQTRQLRELAMRDELTGVWNRRYFNRFLARILERAALDRQQVTLLVFDIDDFKSYNDLHGHAAGDAILAGAAQLMQSTVRSHDVVARIGGDEFAVIFWDPRGRREEGSSHPDDVLAIARRFQRAVTDLRFPQLSADAPGTLTVSGGIAGFPWDGRTPAELLQKADLMALESKAQGKNAITLGAGREPPA
ncbi:sensor domain-containing diguanylate cyclase [Phycisphaera mikurensis]|uniref:diguanylate cyclase n=1 Tax=Phycisphaera mikurensis (strain NBRC 102666 / KCTC 22515 / FYK2301M01) TaxID=1142394 RepID=I0ICK0_PHYMF|nr:GGDEF domain-containing protein [Phycisphaera mikurensis]MBB6442135.1 diguanylate cyclase (GGDEF)-like protein [Phycisphaera mikurensis]BAM02988.1 hypothetical protein PSMK_08290 [Phycisphaera mikurensis NBRC 102666]